MKRQARNYFYEAKWYKEGYTPTIEEYLRVGRVTACYSLFSPISFLGMGDVASIEAFEWIESDPKSLIGSGVIGRIMNDITSHKVNSCIFFFLIMIHTIFYLIIVEL